MGARLISLATVLAAALAQPARADAPEGRLEFDVSAGAVMPGNMTPKEVFPTHTGVGPIVRIEGNFAPMPSLEFGPYFSLSSHPVTSIDGLPTYDQSGSILVFSTGGAARYRVQLAPWLILRLGGYIGLNVTNAFIAHKSGGGEGMPGVGLSLGPIVNLRARLGSHFAALLQVGFLSQPIGSATFPSDTDRSGQSVGFAYPPMFFFNVGPEVFF